MPVELGGGANNCSIAENYDILLPGDNFLNVAFTDDTQNNNVIVNQDEISHIQTHQIPVAFTALPHMSTAITETVTNPAHLTNGITTVAGQVPIQFAVPVQVMNENSVHFVSLLVNGTESGDSIQIQKLATTEEKGEADIFKDGPNMDCEFAEPQRSSTPEIQYVPSLNETILAGNLVHNKNIDACLQKNPGIIAEDIQKNLTEEPVHVEERKIEITDEVIRNDKQKNEVHHSTVERKENEVRTQEKLEAKDKVYKEELQPKMMPVKTDSQDGNRISDVHNETYCKDWVKTNNGDKFSDCTSEIKTMIVSSVASSQDIDMTSVSNRMPEVKRNANTVRKKLFMSPSPNNTKNPSGVGKDKKEM